MEYEIVRAGQSNLVASERSINQDTFNRWTAYIGKSQKTQETYTRAIRQFAKYITSRGITAPVREDIIDYKKELEAEGKKPTTITAYIAAVRLFFQWTAIEGIYPNVADRVEGEKLDKSFKKDYLTSRQVNKLLGSVDTASESGLRDYAILALMATCGLRTVEVSRANIEDMRASGDEMVLYLQGKGHTERTDYVKLSEPLEEAIRAYLKTRKDYKPTDPLFTSVSHRDYGQRITTKSVSRLSKEALERAGLKTARLTAHSLRHTAAIINLSNGGSLTETQGLLRHSSPEITKIYTHLMERKNNNSEYRISKAIFGR